MSLKPNAPLRRDQFVNLSVAFDLAPVRLADSHAMSWNLLIYKPGDTPQNNKPLGNLDAVTEAFTAAFIGLEWESPTEAALPVDGGFRVELTEEDGTVQDAYTHGGFNHIRQFAAVCKREGWRLADAGFGEDVDLDDPQRWYEERSG